MTTLAHDTTGRFQAQDPVERFWAKVDKGSGCWEWNGSRLLKGLPYGRFSVGRTTVQAHRYSLELHLGRPLRPGMWALHRCDNPPCVRPDHLYEGTPSQNSRERDDKGRNPNGAPALRRRLTHCKNGHAFTPENTYRRNGHRDCRRCVADAQKRYRTRKLAAAVMPS